MKMNKWTNSIIQYSFYLLALLLMAACSNDESSNTDGEEYYDGVTLSFCSNSGLTTSTRTSLSGSENVQHVTDVQLYVFDKTGTCVASEDVAWSDHFNATDFTANRNPEMSYRVKYRNFAFGESYTFLAVGRDRESSATYDFPASITIGSALADLKASLATGSDWKAMRESELFAGQSVLTYKGIGMTGRVDLYRRVAGVMGWFTNLPKKINGLTPTSLRIVLYKKQNQRVPLLPLAVTPLFLDYVDSPLTEDGGDVLVDIPLDETILSETVYSKGSYVLPVPAPPTVNENDYTLRVELVNGSQLLRSKRAKLGNDDPLDSSTSSGTGIIDTQGPFRFPLIANQFYGIGSADKPIDMGGGDDIFVTFVSPDVSPANIDESQITTTWNTTLPDAATTN